MAVFTPHSDDTVLVVQGFLPLLRRICQVVLEGSSDQLTDLEEVFDPQLPEYEEKPVQTEERATSDVHRQR